MIELLKYLANNLEPEQLLEVAYIISHNPDMISQEEFMEIVNDVNDYEKNGEWNEEEFKSSFDEFMEHKKKKNKKDYRI